MIHWSHMKIAYFTSNRTPFPPASDQIAASTTVTMNIINELKHRHQITLYAAKGSHIEGVEIVDLDLPPISIDSSLADSDWITKAVIGQKQIYLGAIAKDAHQYDVLHIQTEPTYLGWHLSEIVKTPILFTSHNTYHSFEKPIFQYYRDKIRFSALSKAQLRQMPFPGATPVIYNGVELDQFPFSPDADDYILFLGRLVDDKGIQHVLSLSEVLPSFQFYIAGRGPKQIEEEIKSQQQKQKNIKFFGMVPRMTPLWLKLLSHAKALIMPIEYEDTCPLVPLEAMACGTPVLAYRRGALDEQVLDGKTGYVVDPDEKSMLEAINKLYSLSDEAYGTMRANARHHIEHNHTSVGMAKQYESLYQALAHSKLRS